MKILKVLPILTVLGLQSCFVQNARVITIKSNARGLDTSTFLYSNDSFTVQYNYYTDGLNLNMVIYNKLDKPLFIDWGQSFYIQGTSRYCDWTDSKTVQFNPDDQTETVEKTDRYSNIPPRTSITKSAYYNAIPANLIAIPMKFHFNRLKPTIKISHHLKSDSFKVYETDFTLANTPLIFRNYLTLSYDSKFNSQFYLDQQFWVSKVQDMDVDDYLDPQGEWINGDPYKSNNSFFIRYDPRDYYDPGNYIY